MALIHVIGMGLEGKAGLCDAIAQIVARADLLVGSDRLLNSVPESGGRRLQLSDLTGTLAQIQDYRQRHPLNQVVILATGDPLFFGIGRLLLTAFSPEELVFHPNVSSIQLAFSRLKMPWQDACFISVHGRSFRELEQALKKGVSKLAVLSDPVHSPAAIAQFVLTMDLPSRYLAWVCENLGGEKEQVQSFDLAMLQHQTFASLSVVVLLQQTDSRQPVDPSVLPTIGIRDGLFLGFTDRPGLITKREIRTLVIGELGLQPQHYCWDIGAGTGAMSIEIARIVTQGRVDAIEQSAAGLGLVRANLERFGVSNVTVIAGQAPDVLPVGSRPDRVFIGGSGSNLLAVLDCCQTQLASDGRIVLAIATMEHFTQTIDWCERQQWQLTILHAQLSRSVPVAQYRRLQPLNPVYIMTLQRS